MTSLGMGCWLGLQHQAWIPPHWAGLQIQSEHSWLPCQSCAVVAKVTWFSWNIGFVLYRVHSWVRIMDTLFQQPTQHLLVLGSSPGRKKPPTQFYLAFSVWGFLKKKLEIKLPDDVTILFLVLRSKTCCTTEIAVYPCTLLLYLQ